MKPALARGGRHQRTLTGAVVDGNGQYDGLYRLVGELLGLFAEGGEESRDQILDREGRTLKFDRGLLPEIPLELAAVAAGPAAPGVLCRRPDQELAVGAAHRRREGPAVRGRLLDRDDPVPDDHHRRGIRGAEVDGDDWSSRHPHSPSTSAGSRAGRNLPKKLGLSSR